MPDVIFVQSGPINFDGGVPVGGWSNVAIYPDGRYSFSGHFHDSGEIPYETSVIWWIKSKSGTVFTFGNHVSMGGIFTSGNADFALNGVNSAIAAAWGDLSAGWTSNWSSRASIDLGSLWDSVKASLGAVGSIVAVVGALA